MEAVGAALGCSLMMLVPLAAFAWYASRRRLGGEANAVAALRAEVAELRKSEPAAPSDDPAGRG